MHSDTRDRCSPNMADEPPPLDFSDEDRSPAPPEDKEELEYTPFRDPVEEPTAQQVSSEQDKEPEPPKEQGGRGRILLYGHVLVPYSIPTGPIVW